MDYLCVGMSKKEKEASDKSFQNWLWSESDQKLYESTIPFSTLLEKEEPFIKKKSLVQASLLEIGRMLLCISHQQETSIHDCFHFPARSIQKCTY